MEQAKKILKSYYHVYERFKRDSTCNELNSHDINQLNLAYREIFGRFADLGCSDCIKSMFKRAFIYYENNMKESEIKIPEQSPIDYSEKTYKEIMLIAKEKKIEVPRNISKSELIKLIQ